MWKRDPLDASNIYNQFKDTDLNRFRTVSSGRFFFLLNPSKRKSILTY